MARRISLAFQRYPDAIVFEWEGFSTHPFRFVLALIAYHPRWASQACHNGQAAGPRSMSRVNCSGNGSMMVSSDTRRDPAFEEDFDTGEGGRSSRCLSATCHCDVAIIDCTATFAKTASPIGIGSSRMDSCDLSQR